MGTFDDLSANTDGLGGPRGSSGMFRGGPRLKRKKCLKGSQGGNSGSQGVKGDV